MRIQATISSNIYKYKIYTIYLIIQQFQIFNISIALLLLRVVYPHLHPQKNMVRNMVVMKSLGRGVLTLINGDLSSLITPTTSCVSSSISNLIFLAI